MLSKYVHLSGLSLSYEPYRVSVGGQGGPHGPAARVKVVIVHHLGACDTRLDELDGRWPVRGLGSD